LMRIALYSNGASPVVVSNRNKYESVLFK